MPRPTSLTPTDGELEILKIVWELGRPTVRDVFDVVCTTRSIELVTITTAMTIMVDKGLLRIADPRRPKKFEAVKTQKTTYRAMLKNLADRISGGSIKQLLEQTLGRSKMSAAEEAKIEEEFGKDA